MRVLIYHEDPRSSEEGTGGGAESLTHDLEVGLQRLGHSVRLFRGQNIAREVAQWRPDLVHVSTIHNFLGTGPLRWLQEAKVKHVVVLMDYWPFCGSRMLLHDGDRSCPAVCQKCDNSCGQDVSARHLALVNGSFIIALNPYTADIYRRNGLRVDAICELGVDTERFRPDHSMRTPEPSIYTHSAWAEFPTKGMHILAAALGPTPWEANLMCRLPREAVAENLRRAHVHVFPSTYEETWGYCLNEAMASGCACIASDVAGARAQIKDGENGLLVPPRNVEALRTAIERVMLDEQLRSRLGYAARAKCETWSNLDSMAGRFERAYQEALHGSPNRNGSPR